MNRQSFVLILLTLLYGCINNHSVKQVTWTGSTHSLADTIINNKGDTLVTLKSLHILHSIHIKENGEGMLMVRKKEGAPREFYTIRIHEDLKKRIFELAGESDVTSFKQDLLDSNRAGRMYCGCNYLLTIGHDKKEENITYLPPDANIKLKTLDSLFNIILDKPEIVGPSNVDTITFDSLVFEKVQLFNPMPPLRSTVKFERPENEHKQN